MTEQEQIKILKEDIKNNKKKIDLKEDELRILRAEIKEKTVQIKRLKIKINNIVDEHFDDDHVITEEEEKDKRQLYFDI